MNLSISSFKKAPGAFIIATTLLLFTNYLAGVLVENSTGEYNRRVYELNEQEKTQMLIVGNSRVKTNVILPIIEDNVFGEGENKASLLFFSGGMPRGYLYALKLVEYKVHAPGGVLVLGASPYEFNRYGYTHRARYTQAFFLWKDFFCDLLPNGRWYEMKIFLLHCTVPLMNVKSELSEIVYKFLPRFKLEGKEAKAPEVDRSVVSEKLTNEVFKVFEEKHYINYTIDGYQINSISQILKECKEKQIKAVLLVWPISSGLRQVLGRDSLDIFMEQIYSISSKNGSFVVDYVSLYSGDEYQYYDASHMTSESAKVFSKKLAADLKQIIE